ncbi:MAG: class II fructose-bisphosphate aldolase [Planctomycetaceae bacterium]|nr:class II fructose-bisphosphate aldolase [Planctomycetaceae bacterium]
MRINIFGNHDIRGKYVAWIKHLLPKQRGKVEIDNLTLLTFVPFVVQLTPDRSPNFYSMLCTAKELLTVAREKRYAVPGFNCVADVMIRGILDRAERLRSPVFLMLYSVEIDDKTWWYFPNIVRAVAERYAIPIVMHLDHATELDPIRAALDNGFTSVMYDGSNLPFDQNVEMTRKAVELAQPYGASVEAELGLVGGFGLAATVHVPNVLTQPSEVVTFIERTGVDSLAVAIGTSHGVYKQLPQLDIPLLKELNAASTVPLVLHGGSGTPDDQIRAAIENGICKFNVYADSRVGMWRRFKKIAAETERNDTLPNDYITQLREALGDVVEEKAMLAGAVGRA